MGKEFLRNRIDCHLPSKYIFNSLETVTWNDRTIRPTENIPDRFHLPKTIDPLNRVRYPEVHMEKYPDCAR